MTPSRSKFDTIKTASSYKRLMLGFVVGVIVILGLIIYFSFSRTVITLTLKPQPSETQTSIAVVSAETLPTLSSPGVAGYLLQTEQTDTSQIIIDRDGESVPDNATGTVTIYNNWSETQPLAATTRLLSLDGVLFRIRDRVDVPAGGKLENVTVYADQPGPDGNIEPTTFTIPGLWEGLQDKIYAESTSPMTGGLKTVTALTQQDIANARDDVLGDMTSEAIAVMKGDQQLIEYGDTIDPDAVIPVVLSTTTDPVAGTETSTFSLTVEARFVAVVYDEPALVQLTRAAFLDNLPSQTEALPDSIMPTVSVANYDTDTNTASLTVTVNGLVTPNFSHQVFDREAVTNKDEQQIKAYYANFDEVSAVDIRFSPFWVSRSPGLIDHIKIKTAD